MSQDKENVSRTAASDAAAPAAMTDDNLSEAERFRLLTENMISTLREMPKLCADTMKEVVVRIENTVSSMEKVLNMNGKAQKDKK